MCVWRQTASAQINITIPKIPKIKKEKPAPSTSNSQAATGESSTPSQPIAPADAGQCSGDAVLNAHLQDIEKTRIQAEDYKFGVRDYYVENFSDNENLYLKAAEWLSRWPVNMVQCLNPALDNLAAIAKRTLPTYHPTAYSVRNVAEEKVLRSAINDIAEATVFRGGFKQATWLIEKDGYNFPTSRFKYGIIWAKYPNRDDGFCRIIYVNLVQDYAGGGTYGASYGKFVVSEFAGYLAGN